MTVTQSDAETISRWQQERRMELMATPEVKKLLGSDQFQVALDLLSKRKRPPRKKWEPALPPLEFWICSAVRNCLADPELAETMTGKQRRDHADAIAYHAESLWDLIAPFMHERSGFGWPFQPPLDALALELSLDYVKGYDFPAEEVEERAHSARFAIYYLLMHRMEDALSTLVECGDWFASQETVLKKPNDPNAKRLYFLRKITQALYSSFRSPCRGVALALASVFFDCSDLDEASISKLAPVKRPTPVEIPRSELETLAAALETRLAALGDGDGDGDRAEELRDHLNFYRNLIEKSSG